jgi:glycosyltransferase involved in cell wall biosynthesis
MSQPVVSVVLCTYNGEKFLREQLESILNQTYRTLEIIIVDDHSTDGTYPILQEYAAKESRIRLYQNEHNLGYAENFNKGCQLASADIVAISDQDDIWHPEKIERMINSWPSGSSLIYCDSQRFTGDFSSWNVQPKKSYRRFEGSDIRKLAVFNTISGHAILARKSLLEQVFPVEPGVFYDWKAGVIAAASGGVTYLPQTLVLQRIHQQNITINKGVDLKTSENKARFKQMVITHLLAFEKLPQVPDRDKLFFSRLASLFEQSLLQNFSWPLFLLLVKNGREIFWHKRKILSFVTRIKYARKLASL